MSYQNTPHNTPHSPFWIKTWSNIHLYTQQHKKIYVYSDHQLASAAAQGTVVQVHWMVMVLTIRESCEPSRDMDDVETLLLDTQDSVSTQPNLQRSA